jgi:phage antirepressor YoqD-like protein
MSNIPPEQLFTMRQVARSLRVGEKQVRQWIRAGELAVIDLGDVQRPKQRVLQADLQKFLESRRVVHQPPAPRTRSRPATGKQWF